MPSNSGTCVLVEVGWLVCPIVDLSSGSLCLHDMCLQDTDQKSSIFLLKSGVCPWFMVLTCDRALFPHYPTDCIISLSYKSVRGQTPLTWPFASIWNRVLKSISQERRCSSQLREDEEGTPAILRSLTTILLMPSGSISIRKGSLIPEKINCLTESLAPPNSLFPNIPNGKFMIIAKSVYKVTGYCMAFSYTQFWLILPSPTSLPHPSSPAPL